MVPGATPAAGHVSAKVAVSADDEQREALVPPSGVPSGHLGRQRAAGAAARWPRTAALGAAAAAAVVLLAASPAAGAREGRPAAARLGAATGLVAEASREEGAQLLAGDWSYGQYGLYRTSRDDQGVWHFTEETATGHKVSGSLLPHGAWLEGELSAESGQTWGKIRVRRGKGQTLVSNFRPDGNTSNWSAFQDVIAHKAGANYFVFLEVFRLSGTKWVLGGLYHTQMLICNRSEFKPQEQEYIKNLELGSHGFAEVPKTWWEQSGAHCVAMGFGGSPDEAPCSGVGERQQDLSQLEALIPNVDRAVGWKYFYGTGSFSGVQATKRICSPGCGSHWSGSSYDMVAHNCNTFTSTVLHCVYGLSEKKPHLGVSDMRWANCKC